MQQRNFQVARILQSGVLQGFGFRRFRVLIGLVGKELARGP